MLFTRRFMTPLCSPDAPGGAAGTGAPAGGESGGGAPAGGAPGAGGGDAHYRQLQSQIQEMRSESKKSQSELARIRRAVSGEPEGGGKPQKWVDPMIDRLLHAERAGNPMPITAEAVMKVQEVLDRQESSDKQLREALAEIQRLSDPTHQQQSMVYANLDNALVNGLEKVYGHVPEHIHEALSGQIADHVLEIQKTAPDMWNQIRLDPRMQEKMINFFVMKMVPQNAKKLMLQAAEAAQPVTAKDYDQAWHDLSRLPPSPARAEMQRQLRIQILEHNLSQNRRSRG